MRHDAACFCAAQQMACLLVPESEGENMTKANGKR
jgi:hypothetical protein